LDLFLATDDFHINGVAYPDFPLLVNKDMELVEEVLDFLIKHCITRGRVQSPESWKAYGKSMYDFFGFIEANDWDWRNVSVNRDSTILATYRDWSLGKLGLSSSTVNFRLRIVIKFYQHALRRGWIESLPYELEYVCVRQPKGFLAHTDARGGVVVSPDVMLKQKATQIGVLSKDEAKAFLSAIINPTPYLIAKLALQTGLRKEELCSFPLAYVKNPQSLPNLSSQVSVALDPRDMKIKGSKPRTIDIPI
jgi:integrase/recombinase XerD